MNSNIYTSKNINEKEKINYFNIYDLLLENQYEELKEKFMLFNMTGIENDIFCLLCKKCPSDVLEWFNKHFTIDFSYGDHCAFKNAFLKHNISALKFIASKNKKYQFIYKMNVPITYRIYDVPYVLKKVIL
jgi:hypothetical protein